MVTGGAGFLGKPRRAAARGAAAQRRRRAPLAPSTTCASSRCQRALPSTVAPEVVLHLAAVVGGIGANRDNPGRFFYDNAIMGIQLIEQSRLAGVKKFVAVGTVCAYPKFTPVPFQRGRPLERLPEETNAPYGLAKKMLLVQCQAYRRAVRLQRASTCCRSTSTAPTTTSTSRTRT